MLKKVSQQVPFPTGGPTAQEPAPPPTLEDQVLDMVQQKISRDYPYLMKYITDIKTVDKSEESSSFIFAATIRTPAKDLILPIFVVNGIIKPMNLLYDKELDSYIPNTEAWINFSESALYSSVGESIKTPKDLKTDVDVRNLVIPPTTGRYSYASDPGEIVLRKIASLSRKEKNGLLNFFSKNEDILAKCAEYYGEDALKVAFTTNTDEPKLKSDNKTFEIISSLDNEIAKKNKFYFNSIVNKGYAIKDNRDKKTLNKAVIIQEPEYYFQINQPGIYRVWTTDGIKDVIVGLNLSANVVYGDRGTSIAPVNVSDYKRAERKSRINSSNAFVPDSYIGGDSNYFILDSDGKLMLVDPHIRETYTALKILDPNTVTYDLFRKIFDNIHETNISEINNVKDDQDSSKGIDKRILFISVKPNGSVSGISLPRTSIDSIIKRNGAVIISVNGWSNELFEKVIFDPDISGQDFKVVSNGHEKILILPYNVKFVETTKADYDILDVSNVNNNFKAFIEGMGGRKVVNINNAAVDNPEKLANEIADIAYECWISIPEAEIIKTASVDNVPVDIFIVTNEIYNTLEKFAEFLDDPFNTYGANTILSIPYMMHKIGQAMGQMMTGDMPPPPADALMAPGPVSQLPPPGMGGYGPDVGQMPPPGVDAQAVIDKYIEDMGEKLKDLNNKMNEIKNMLSILSDIKGQTGGQLTPKQQEVADLIRNSGELSEDAFSASMILGMSNELDFEKNIMSYLPVILKGIDSIGRIIVNIYAKSSQIANTFGEKFKNAIEDKANRVFKQLSDFYMFLRGAKITNVSSKS
ncbi:MAG: hypothetical protein ABIM30_00300 [candidate division WOR-3 bacterium]